MHFRRSKGDSASPSDTGSPPWSSLSICPSGTCVLVAREGGSWEGRGWGPPQPLSCLLPSLGDSASSKVWPGEVFRGGQGQVAQKWMDPGGLGEGGREVESQHQCEDQASLCGHGVFTYPRSPHPWWGDIWPCLGMVLGVTPGGQAGLVHSVGRSRGAAECPAVYKTGPKEFSSPQC